MNDNLGFDEVECREVECEEQLAWFPIGWLLYRRIVKDTSDTMGSENL